MSDFIRRIILTALVCLAAVSCGKDPMALQIKKIAEMDFLETTTYELNYLTRNGPSEYEQYKPGKRVLLYSGVARITAGIDLSGFSYDNVEIDKAGGTITVTLPQPMISIVEIPEDRIKKEYEKVSPFRSSFMAQEKEQIKKDFEDELRKKVIPGLGIEDEARKDAREFMTITFNALGYENVFVKFKDER
ncbi:MAG: DUF4230 domain-containing protein [Bacteroidales bacterium]|nr:DUF4230 domain-containing protein [Bacteroidales bacterium]